MKKASMLSLPMLGVLAPKFAAASPGADVPVGLPIGVLMTRGDANGIVDFALDALMIISKIAKTA